MRALLKMPKLVHVTADSMRGRAEGGEIEFASMDVPVVVRLDVGKSGFEVCDGLHVAECKVAKEALFWFKLTNGNKSLSELKGAYITLDKYALQSRLDKHNDVKFHVNVLAFSPLGDEETRGLNFSRETARSILQEPELRPLLENLRTSHLQAALKSQLEDLPELEDILRGRKSGNREGPKLVAKVSIKSESEDRDDMIDFGNIERIEEAIAKDVAFILKLHDEPQNERSNKEVQRIAIDFPMLSQFHGKALVTVLESPKKAEEQKDTRTRIGREKVEEAKVRKRRKPEGKEAAEKGLKEAAI
eukprot:TRINITY_DN10648_c0_g6_i1.p2 TRINITY_DN10648_c0_g6~~TRINITY_DN10648_c0_g6_i1.p2  ORF type:complete len:303 (-),score=90.75 TRINITY_DN10648_c0_g6_i1:258-1166(-)